MPIAKKSFAHKLNTLCWGYNNLFCNPHRFCIMLSNALMNK
ncbi:hypothetical protein [Klebsiella pneumoniae IS46]|nr:hypothetical protein TRKP064_2372 [Klebsiella pneumoniae]BBE67057.1 hypothetical protein TRKP067_2372 [Klebsiella pneumoniae]CDL16673.1 hypothetical protein [Klebsiella pneumoniae IS46]